MKKALLFLLSIPVYHFAQSFDVSNEPPFGSLVSLHLCDSNANLQTGIMGANATWDFSQIAGIFGVTKDVQILVATQDVNFSSFTGATHLYDIGGNLQTFYNTSPNGRISQGFVFNEVSLGAVVASWNIDAENLMAYPFGMAANPLLDNFSGTVTSGLTGTVPSTGSSVAVVDGSGTLMLPGGNSYNVIRYHLKDSANATIFGNNVAFVRNVYEYYDFATSTLPVFITMQINVNSALLNNSSTVILSKDQPLTFVGLEKPALVPINLFPNPASEYVSIEGIAVGAPYCITNILGQCVNQGTYDAPIYVSDWPNGVYFVKTQNSVETFIKK
ncbi:MAG: T9SS type A sorting domain-containing protein [Flavobacteriales bacterium]